jgi:mono/diheme cytochrome c family protein
MRTFTALIVLALVTLAGGLAFIYSGAADVAATSPHWKLTRWVLSTTMERSVRSRAAALTAPPGLGDEDELRDGGEEYAEMCEGCHGAPDEKPGVVARGLNPRPPKLVHTAREWTLEQVFWITKHGVRMTGMPAFGPTHSDPELWEIAAFVKRLPDLDAAGYRALTGEAEGQGDHHGLERAHDREPSSEDAGARP